MPISRKTAKRATLTSKIISENDEYMRRLKSKEVKVMKEGKAKMVKKPVARKPYDPR